MLLPYDFFKEIKYGPVEQKAITSSQIHQLSSNCYSSPRFHLTLLIIPIMNIVYKVKELGMMSDAVSPRAKIIILPFSAHKIVSHFSLNSLNLSNLADCNF